MQDVELAYRLPDAYFHQTTRDDGFDYTLYNKDFTERDGGILETEEIRLCRRLVTELLAKFGCDAAEGRVMDAAELREQADTVAETARRSFERKDSLQKDPAPETLRFCVAECLEFTFAESSTII